MIQRHGPVRARMGGMSSSHPQRTPRSLIAIKMLWLHQWRQRYLQPSLQEMDYYSCYSPWRVVLFSGCPPQQDFNTPTAPGFLWKLMTNGINILAINCNVSDLPFYPNSPTHPLTQARPPTTDSCESLLRVMGCKCVNPTLPCLSLITRLDSCRRLEFFRRSCSRDPTLLSLASDIGPAAAQLGPEADSSADIAPTADYWGRLVDTGPLLQCCFTDSSCLRLIVLPAAP